MEQLKGETIELLTSENLNEYFWLFELGRAEMALNDGSTMDNQFMHSFLKRGEAIWELHKEKIKKYICNENGEPKTFVKEAIEGNIKDLIVNIISLLMTQYSLSLAIAVPLCGLAIKRGFYTICLA